MTPKYIIAPNGKRALKVKPKKATVEFSKIELEAAFEACSNYTPKPRQPWKQAAQTRAVNKISLALWRLTHGRAPQ